MNSAEKSDEVPRGDDERALLAGVRQGDAASCERLVRAYGARMLGVARRLLRNEDDARDCLQDAFLQVFRNIGRFEERSSLGSWLHRIVVNAALMRLRARARQPEDPIDDLLPRFAEDGHRLEPGGPRPFPVEAEIERGEAYRRVHRAIARLPDGYRNVLMLRDIEEYATEEVAALLQTTPGAIKVRLHRARAALKALLEKEP